MKEWSKKKKVAAISAASIVGLAGIGSMQQPDKNSAIVTPVVNKASLTKATASTPEPVSPVPQPSPEPVLTPPPAPVVVPTPQPVAPAPQASNCNPNYTPCLPNVSDLNCPDIGHQVQVIGSDPYHLDADHDGTGCDSY